MGGVCGTGSAPRSCVHSHTHTHTHTHARTHTHTHTHTHARAHAHPRAPVCCVPSQVQARDSNNNLVTTGGAALTGAIVSDDFVVQVAVTDHLNGTYTMEYVSVVAGQLTLSVKLAGQVFIPSKHRCWLCSVLNRQPDIGLYCASLPPPFPSCPVCCHRMSLTATHLHRCIDRTFPTRPAR